LFAYISKLIQQNHVAKFYTTTMPLTRLLYDSAYAHASLALSFVTATSIQEPLFWCEELLTSGFVVETFDALWIAHYATCAINYPHIAEYITDIVTVWAYDTSTNLPKHKHIHHIVSKLFTCARSSTVLNHYAHHVDTDPNSCSCNTHKKPVSVLRGKSPAWVSAYNPLSHQVLRHIHRKHPDKALALVARSDNIEFVNAVVEACAEYLGEPHSRPAIYKDTHIVVAKLHAFTTILRKLPHDLPEPHLPHLPHFPTPPLCEHNPATESHRHSLVGPDVNDVDLNIPPSFTQRLFITDPTAHKVLRTYRLFPHHPHAHIFATGPEPPPFDAVCNNWLNLCVGCPLWDERIKRAGGNGGHNIVFDDVADETTFHTQFNTEFDEQPLHIQQMSIDSVPV